MNETEKELVAMVLAGRTEAFEPLVTPYRRPLVALAYRLTRDREEALEFTLRPEVSGDTKNAVVKTQVRLRKVERLGSSQGKPITDVTTLIESTLNIKSGERTVVGISKLDGGDKGLILIISGKTID